MENFYLLNAIQDYFYGKPGRLTAVGRTVTITGAALLVAAAWGSFVTGAINKLPTLSGQQAGTKTLADIYPTLPLWWIPESGFGTFTALILVISGLVAYAGGRCIDRLHNMH